MHDYQQRIIDEKKELDEKLELINFFFDSQTYFALSESEQVRIRKQGDAMELYSQVLTERINAF